jgi:hypothetical protein
VRCLALDSIAALFDRLGPVIAGARRAVRTLATLGALAGVLIGWALFADGVPEETDSLIARVFVLVLAFVPAGVLMMLWLALGEVLKIPERIQRLPEAARGHAVELEEALRDLDGPRGGRKRRLRAVWRLAKLPAGARETLLVYAPLTALLSVPFLAASIASALIVPAELIVAVVAVLLAT